MNFNLINPEDVNSYLSKFSDDPEVARLLNIALETPLKKRHANIRVVDKIPENAPEWLQKKWDSKEIWHEFHPKKDIRLAGLIAVITRWIESAIEAGEEWLSLKDSRDRPLKLLKIGSLEQAMKIAQKSQTYYKCKFDPENLIDTPDEDIAFIQEVTEDIHVVRLLTPKALDRESHFLGHCIGNDGYDDALLKKKFQFFSFRDKSNIPLMTLQVDFLTKKFVQCRTKNNGRAQGELLNCLNIFAKSKNVFSPVMVCDFYLYSSGTFSNDLHDLAHLSKITGNLCFHNPAEKVILAEELQFQGDLSFYGYGYKSLKLPKILSVEQSLSFISCPFLKSLPRALKVKDSFEIAYCDKVMKIPDLYSLAGSFQILHCHGVRVLCGESLLVQGSILIDNCPLLTDIPQEIICQDFISISHCKSLTALPKKLHAKGGLRVTGCDNLRELPEDFVVKGYIYTEFGVFDDVEAYRNAFAKHTKKLNH